MRIKFHCSFSRAEHMEVLQACQGERIEETDTRDDILLGYKFYGFPKRLSNAKNSMAPTISRHYRNQIFSSHNTTRLKSCAPKPSRAEPDNVAFIKELAEYILVPASSDIIQFQLFSFRISKKSCDVSRKQPKTNREPRH